MPQCVCLGAEAPLKLDAKWLQRRGRIYAGCMVISVRDLEGRLIADDVCLSGLSEHNSSISCFGTAVYVLV